MKQKNRRLRLVVLVTAMMCALGASAQEAYANYTPSNTTLTFYYDNLRSTRTGTTYDLNTGGNDTGWDTDGTKDYVTKVVFDPSFADARPTTTYDWFYGMTSLQSITGISYLNTSEVTNMAYMFSFCNKLTNIDLSHFVTYQVVNMRSMFTRCSGLTSINLSSFNTSKVTNMYNMFYKCSGLASIYVGGGWSTAAVTDSEEMFYDCTNLVGGQGTTYDANHTDKAYARIDGGSSNPGYLTRDPNAPEAYACYNPSITTLTFYYDNLRSTRPGTTYNLNTGNYDTGWDTDGTKSYVTKVVFDPSFANARPTVTYDWFYEMTNLESIKGMSYLNTSEVTNMAYMFDRCNKLMNLDVSHFNTSKVTNMNYMFGFCYNLTNLDLSSFNTSKVTNMYNMFYKCSGLASIYVGGGWSTAAVTNSEEMFYDCTNLVGGQGTTYDANHTDKAYAHIDGGSSNPGYFTDINTTMPYACYTPSNTTLTFYYDNQRGSRQGTTYDLNTDYNDTGWDTDGTTSYVTKVVFDPSFANARPTTTCDWFCNMSKLQTITGISYLNTSMVTNMAYMFANCNKLTDIDLSHFSTSKVIKMYNMFYDCTNLRTIYAGSGWTTGGVTSSGNMFKNCTKLVGGQGTTFDPSHTDKSYARIDRGSSYPGYFTAKYGGKRGDVDGNGDVNMDDLTALINYLLTGDSTGINITNAVSCDNPSSTVVNMDDLTALINYLLTNIWS